MWQKSIFPWGLLLAGFFMASIVLEYSRSVETSAASVATVAAIFLPMTLKAPELTPPTELESTIAALGTQGALQGTQIALQGTQLANWSQSVSYLLTGVPDRNQHNIEILFSQDAHLATQVAELYAALGSPVPTPPPSPTFGPSPFPTITPYVTTVTPTRRPTQTLPPTPSGTVMPTP